LYSKSFGYKLEFLYKMVSLGAKVKETPLQFGLRTAGESKIESKTAKDIFRSCFLLRWNDQTTQKFIKFGCIGLFGFSINKIGLDVFSNLFKGLIDNVGIRNTFANALASEFSIISNFILNNLWTFKNEKLLDPYLPYLSVLFTKGIIISSNYFPAEDPADRNSADIA